jgi:hypothetical protein
LDALTATLEPLRPSEKHLGNGATRAPIYKVNDPARSIPARRGQPGRLYAR